MAKAKNYNNYVEVVGNVCEKGIVKSETAGIIFNLANHRRFTKKDHTKGEDTEFLRVHVRPGRKYAKIEDIQKGAFLRIKGHLENNSYKDEATGEYHNFSMEIAADTVTVIPRKEAEASAAEPAEGEAAAEE